MLPVGVNMLTLSVRQPWAYAIMELGKDIENRSWETSVRGPVLLHAGKTVDDDGLLWLEQRGFWVPARPSLLRGGIIGLVDIVDCVTSSKSSWFFGEYGFVIENPRRVRFYACPGHLGFFNVRYPGG